MSTATALTTEHRVLAAGFGGQGVLTIGKLMCTAAVEEDLQVTYFPSYGSEVRGGTANCQVVLSPRSIYNPQVESADSLIILNELSFEHFTPRLVPGGLLLVNTSAVNLAQHEAPEGADLLALPAIAEAADLGEVRVANVVMLGAWAQRTGIVGLDSCGNAIRELLVGRKAQLQDVNLAALARGAELAD